MRKIQLAPTATLFHADCRDALRAMADCSVDAVVTDPPYELNFMGKGWDNTGIANDPALWAEVFRVLKPGGHVAAFSASRTYHRMACAIEDAGFEIRDSLCWLYGTGFPKSQNVAKFIDAALGVAGEKIATGAAVKRMMPGADQNADGWIKDDGREFIPHEYSPGSPQAQEFLGHGTALKPAFEPIVLARKPLSEGTVAANVLRWRTGALNIDACRVTAPDGVPSVPNIGKGRIFQGERVRGEMSVPSDLGRWPANVVHDGSDEVVEAFPTTGGGGTPRAKSPNKGSNWAIGAERSSVPGGATYCDQGSAARFFYSAKASKADRNGSKHPTVKPISLMEWLCTLITPPGGTILDPFGGSGTTARAACNKSFGVLICEREAEYVADIMGRFGPVAPALSPAARFHAWNAKALELQAFLDERVRA